MTLQPSLFEEMVTPVLEPLDLKTARSGTFVDNMARPVHRWFRYSAGFAAEWVQQVLQTWGICGEHVVLDPFAGSGTVAVVCDGLNIRSIGVEAHPVVARICKAKLSWSTSVERFCRLADDIYEGSGEFRKYEVQIEFSNGDHVQGSFESKYGAREFLEFVATK